MQLGVNRGDCPVQYLHLAWVGLALLGFLSVTVYPDAMGRRRVLCRPLLWILL